MTSIARDLRMTPQARKVLGHLEKYGSISPLEAFGTYGITRLASCIHEIRQAEHNVTTDICKDAQSHKYARYTLLAAAKAA